ncbi:metallophosphoesterase family protein [Hyalangium versicolor]|uniref:metallophosphoesterase family protein n=1 Tax=Hyalangium versicolor TaxID=2861190 RepID=UPI001CC8F05C|nr:metallophosphoesterase [Hyalangium versicolor]
MPLRKLAHLSDLHLDLSPHSDAAARALVESLLAERADHVVVTGDLTHQGASAEFRRFREIFAPLLDTDRLTFIPGNHDRPGDDVVRRWMKGRKVCTVEREGLYFVCVDSTGPHNRRSYFASHGALSAADLDTVDAALAAAPREALTAILLHHHVLPLPEESLPERLATRLGWPNASELALGARLVSRVLGRCDLILHGHRHIPREFDLKGPGDRALRVYNSGSSTELGQFRVFQHAGGRLHALPVWQRTASVPTPKTASHNFLPALQHLANQLSTALL